MDKNRKTAQEKILEILHSVPLKIRLDVVNEMMLQSCLIDMGFIPDGFWSDEKEKKYGKFRKFAKEFTKVQIREFKEWEKDGRPGKLKK
jgi:hypothetical protein